MIIEHAHMRAANKPRGLADFRPWSDIPGAGTIGELWFGRADFDARFFDLEGHAHVGPKNVLTGETIFPKTDQSDIKVGSGGLKGLLADSAAIPEPDLLRSLVQSGIGRIAPPTGTY
jgi:hypothetical protein